MTPAEEDSIRVGIADKNPLIREALAHLLDEEGFAVAFVARAGRDFLDTLSIHQPIDVGVIGWEMPDMGGQAVLHALRDRSDPTRILIYTGAPDPDLPRHAMALGAKGFCSKRDDARRLVQVVCNVARGRLDFPAPDLVGRTLLQERLTRRELQLLEAVADGLSTKAIANRLSISTNTIKFHMKNLYDKIGVCTRSQAVAYYTPSTSRSENHQPV